GTVLSDVGHYFAPGRATGRQDQAIATWQFASHFPVVNHVRVDLPPHFGGPRAPNRVPGGLGNTVPPGSRVRNGASGFLRAYQGVMYTPGPLLALALALGLAGMWGARRGARPLRAECFLLASMGFLVLLVPAMTVSFDYRYLLP